MYLCIMINSTKIDASCVLVEFLYDMSELVSMVSDRTVSVAAIMVDEGGDHIEQLSATEDNTWELHRYADEAWGYVTAMTRAYHHCAPTQCDRDGVTQHYQIVLTMPKTWDQPSVIPLDNGIRDYMMATILRRWWLSKGNADQAAVAQEQMERAEREVRYSLNARIRCGRASQWI